MDRSSARRNVRILRIAQMLIALPMVVILTFLAFISYIIMSFYVPKDEWRLIFVEFMFVLTPVLKYSLVLIDVSERSLPTRSLQPQWPTLFSCSKSQSPPEAKC